MDAIFTLPYSEYEAINEIKKKLKGGYSFYIPTSRQQKGIDFIIHNSKNNVFLRIQVKSSRSYVTEPGEKKRGGRIYKNNFWFNNFFDKYKDGNADYYILFGLYPEYKVEKNIKSKKVFWKNFMLCFSEKEMFEHLSTIKKTKKGKMDTFFAVSFDDVGEIFASRGFQNNPDLSQFLLKNKLNELQSRLTM